jgi:hypothetical protein
MFEAKEWFIIFFFFFFVKKKGRNKNILSIYLIIDFRKEVQIRIKNTSRNKVSFNS